MMNRSGGRLGNSAGGASWVKGAGRTGSVTATPPSARPGQQSLLLNPETEVVESSRWNLQRRLPEREKSLPNELCLLWT